MEMKHACVLLGSNDENYFGQDVLKKKKYLYNRRIRKLR